MVRFFKMQEILDQGRANAEKEIEKLLSLLKK